MADQEVIKHTKKIYKIWNSKDNTIWHKLKEFLVEIFIIVFAVSISIWLHNWSEHKHEQELVKTFLIGLKKDLQSDINGVKEAQIFYKNANTNYTFLSKLDKEQEPNSDSLKEASLFIGNSSFLRPHKSRFTGFSSAGKIMTIEKDELVQAILEYYQGTLAALSTSEEAWLNIHKGLYQFLISQGIDSKQPKEVYQVLSNIQGKAYTKRLIPWPQLLERYQNAINDANSIIAMINKLYPEEK